jgi:malonyl-CoA/methylmalonyl-CoA synthetase
LDEIPGICSKGSHDSLDLFTFSFHCHSQRPAVIQIMAPSEPVLSSPVDHDRTYFLPPHDQDNIFPNAPLFSTLLRFATRKPPRIAIRDVNLGIERTHAQLLPDVLALRRQIQNRLSPVTQAKLRKGQELFIALLAPGGYEYTVAFLAILALGAAAVPLSTHVPVEEAAYLLRKSQSIAILTSSTTEMLGTSLETYLKANGSTGFQSIPIFPYLSTSLLSVQDIIISSNPALDENAAGVIIFTSGTTGPPKGVVMRRSFVYDYALSVADHYQLTKNDTILHILPAHHATGIGINFFPFLVSGACIEFRNGSFDASWLWERWRAGGLTFFSGVPTIYMRMMRFYEQKLASLPDQERELYVHGVKNLRGLLCGSSALPAPIQKFWTEIRAGRSILTRYGATEFGAPFKVRPDEKGVPDGSVGQLEIGLDVKLSGGEEGEVLIKSPHMFGR